MISSICVAFLEKMNFTQPALMNYFYYFFQGEEYFAHKLWKIVAALSLSTEFSSKGESSHLQYSNQTMSEKSDPALFCKKDKA